MNPGATAFTRMLWRASSSAKVFVRFATPAFVADYISVEIVDKSSQGDRSSWEGHCDSRTSVVLLGQPADECVAFRDRPNGSGLNPASGWGIQQFAETERYWIVADATGPELGAGADAAVARARAVFRSVAANGLERIK
jgi:hypothetical protein